MDAATEHGAWNLRLAESSEVKKCARKKSQQCPFHCRSAVCGSRRPTCMPPPEVRNHTRWPPPLTAPLRWSCSALPTTETGKSLLTPPPDVSASRSNAAFAGTRTVTPPPEVSRRTLDNGVE